MSNQQTIKEEFKIKVYYWCLRSDYDWRTGFGRFRNCGFQQELSSWNLFGECVKHSDYRALSVSAADKEETLVDEVTVASSVWAAFKINNNDVNIAIQNHQTLNH